MRIGIALPLAVLAALSLSAFAYSQSDEISTWKGELHTDAQLIFDGYTVQLIDVHNHAVSVADVRADGLFEFRRIPPGDYQLVVNDGRGHELYRNYVGSPASPGDLQVRLPEPGKLQRPPSGPVSAAELLHPPPRKALDCFKAAQKFSQAGQFDKAAEQLQKAVQLSPEYTDAHVNLGAQFLRMGRYQDALEEERRALSLGSPNPVALSDLAFAQIALNQPRAAIDSARSALRLNPDYIPAHYVLGMALASAGQAVPEALAHLEKAATTMSTARADLARVRAHFCPSACAAATQ